MAVRGDAEKRLAGGEHTPERAPHPRSTPAGLVDVKSPGLANLATKLLVGLFKRFCGVAYDGVHRADRELGPKELAEKLDGVTAGDAIPDRQGGYGRLKTGAEGSPGNLGG